MQLHPDQLPGVIVVEPQVHADARGFFIESFHAARFAELGIAVDFVQDNQSRSTRGILRGLHYQLRRPQGKLCRVARGEVFDVMVDLREGSPTLGAWCGLALSDQNHRQVYIPPGFAHGFCVISDWADFIYKCTDYYDPSDQHAVVWNDPDLGIEWPINDPILSEKDQNGKSFRDAAKFRAAS
jgi:dTDP-4-dehydrorhamnose 3,5-epimerase